MMSMYDIVKIIDINKNKKQLYLADLAFLNLSKVTINRNTNKPKTIEVQIDMLDIFNYHYYDQAQLRIFSNDIKN